MSKQLGGSARSNPDDGSDDNLSAENSSYFAWEFINDELQRPAPISAVNSAATSSIPVGDKQQNRSMGRGGQSLQRNDATTKAEPENKAPQSIISIPNAHFPQERIHYVHGQLDKALDRWWAVGDLPPLPLLRDALLMLEGGGAVSESQRTLLLRAALAYNRGVQTALHYQSDNERVVFILAEALAEWEPPLNAERLPSILGNGDQLRSLLMAELERSRILLTGEPLRRTENALGVLAQMAAPVQSASGTSQPVVEQNTQGGRRLRQILFLLLVITTIAFVLWNRGQSIPNGMITMPTAEYAMISKNGVGSVHLDAFLIDRFEVTNLEYRACVNAGKCSWPLQTSSATRSDYFTNPAFNGYPVVQVTQVMAQSYCAWVKRRLPTSVEWQAAASVSPTTGQAFPYPWGESFDPQRVNSALSNIGDTVVVGSFRPGGDSASGAVDMAGNVAEWTSTPITGSLTSVMTDPNSKVSVIVKGGSFLSEPPELNVGAHRDILATQAAFDLGFRCALTKLLVPSS